MNGLEVGTDNADLPTHTPLTSMYSVFVTRERNVSVREGRVAGERETLQGDGERERERERRRRRGRETRIARWNGGTLASGSVFPDAAASSHARTVSPTLSLSFSLLLFSLSLSLFFYPFLSTYPSIRPPIIHPLSLSLSLLQPPYLPPFSSPFDTFIYIYILHKSIRAYTLSLSLLFLSLSLFQYTYIYIYISLDGSTLPFLVLSLLVGTPVSGRRRGA